MKLAAEFVPVAEEVYHIYPESDWALGKLKGDPGHELFKRFGEAMPARDWNEGGTKQGIYMMGPNGEYLEGLGAASGSADRMVRRLELALKRWEVLAVEREYGNKPVPLGSAVAPPEIEGADLAFRVSLRDLPRGDGGSEGRRFVDRDMRRQPWMAFTQWAWNQNWLTLGDATVLVPGAENAGKNGVEAIARTGAAEAVDATVVDRIYRRVLVDNVRGQTPTWLPEHVKVATLTMKLLGDDEGLKTIEYQGKALMKSETQRFEATLYGQGVWNVEQASFDSFSLVAVGEREGAGTFNQRAQDAGPAPMGIVLDLFPPKRKAADDSDSAPSPGKSGESR